MWSFYVIGAFFVSIAIPIGIGFLGSIFGNNVWHKPLKKPSWTIPESPVSEAPVSAAAAIFVILLLLHLFAEYYSRIAPTAELKPQERELAKEIRELHRAADTLSTPSTFAKAAKLKRQAAAKEKELAVLRQNLALQRGWWLSLYSTAPKALKAIVYIVLAQWFWHTSVATIPVSLLQPYDYLVSASKQALRGEITVGIIPWLVLTSRVSKFVSTKIVGKSPSKKGSVKKSS